MIHIYAAVLMKVVQSNRIRVEHSVLSEEATSM